MRCLEITLSYECDVDCVFCSHAQIMKAFAPWPLEEKEVQMILLRKRREGFSHVSFVGGEPSLYSRFGAVLRFAKRLGYRTRAVSNGAGFAASVAVKTVLPYLDELCLSIHGGTPESHDLITRSRGSFERIMKALNNAALNPKTITTVNMVATTINIDFLPGLISLINRRAKIKEFWLSELVPIGYGSRRYDELILEHRELAKKIEDMTRRAYPVPLRFYGLPFCVLNGRHQNSVIWGRYPALSVFRVRDKEGKPFLREMDSSLADPAQVLTPKCEACVYREPCGGPGARYYEKFGDAELNPFKSVETSQV